MSSGLQHAPGWASVLQAASGLIGGRGAGVLGLLKCITRCAIVFQEGTELTEARTGAAS